MPWFQRLFGRSEERPASNPEFEALVAEGVAYATQYLRVHQFSWQFGREKKSKLYPQTGLLTFTFDGGREVFCYAQAVGTLDTQLGEWLWAWANPSIPVDLRREVEAVKAHGEQHGFARLTQASWRATAEQAWQMTAVAAKLREHQGTYAITSGLLQRFLMFREVHLNRFEIGP
jgi:hypothetical protein